MTARIAIRAARIRPASFGRRFRDAFFGRLAREPRQSPNEARPVQRPRFDAAKFPPRGEVEMQNSSGLERFVELVAFSRDLGIVDCQHIDFELDAEACQLSPVIAERFDEHRRWIGADARKATETGDENA